MSILRIKDRETVAQRFDTELKRNVTLELYTQRSMGGLYVPGRECKTCGTTQEMMEELTALSSKLELEIKDYYGDPDLWWWILK